MSGYAAFYGLSLVRGSLLAATASEVSVPRIIELLQVVVKFQLLEYALLGVSILVLTLTLERVYTLLMNRGEILSPRLLAAVTTFVRDQHLTREQCEELWDICQSRPSSFSRVVSLALLRVGGNLSEIESACEESLQIESQKVGTVTRHLSLIARIAPLVGLFGTVAGLMVAFFEKAGNSGGGSALLAQGVATALGTTAAGIIVAVLAMLSSHFARNRQQNLFDRMRSALMRLTPLLATLPASTMKNHARIPTAPQNHHITPLSAVSQ